MPKLLRSHRASSTHAKLPQLGANGMIYPFFRFQPFCEVFLSQRGDVFALESAYWLSFTTFSPVSLNSGIVPSQFRAEFGFVHLDSPIKSQTTRMEQVQPVDPIKSRKGLRMSMCAFCPANLWYLVESPRIASAEFGESSKICIPPENAAQSS